MRARYAIGALCSALILGCVSSSTADLYDLWLPLPVEGEDGCEARPLIELPWWKADINRDGDVREWVFTPTHEAYDYGTWICPQRGGQLDCWSHGLGGGAETGPDRVAWLDATVRGDQLSGPLQVLGTPASGNDCESNLTFSARRLEWSGSTLPNADDSCETLSGEGTTASDIPVQLWVFNASNAQIEITYVIVAGSVEAPLSVVGPHSIQSINATAGHVMRANNVETGECVSIVQVQDEGLPMGRWVFGE